MAEEGFLVLAARIRDASESGVVREVIEKVFKKSVDPESVFSIENPSLALKAEMDLIKASSPSSRSARLVWTRQAVRMAALVLHSFRFREPVLLVGETGCGKTSVSAAVSMDILRQSFLTVNCHLNTEATDFLGGLRPCRNREGEGEESEDRLFEWADGPLVNAMLRGHVLLIDEISLADDSVIERVNSVLEEGRALLVPERSGGADVAASEGFQFVATMNPGGDYGKKELSPALRNRFLEIWCPAENSRNDLREIVASMMPAVATEAIVDAVVDFCLWFPAHKISIRDINTWTAFVNAAAAANSGLSMEDAVVQGACLVFFDGLKTATGNAIGLMTVADEAEILDKCRTFFEERLPDASSECLGWINSLEVNSIGDLELGTDKIALGPFSMERRPGLEGAEHSEYLFQTTSVARNAFKLLRGMQVSRPILLEGPPGVGKSALVSAVAVASGNRLVRINLSDQTDVADLFGSDLPAEGEAVGRFEWRDGPFLAALR